MNIETKILSDHIKGDTWNGLEILLEDASVIDNVETFSPKDLTGFSVVAEFTPQFKENVVLELSTDGNTITISEPTNGKIVIGPLIVSIPQNIYSLKVKILKDETIQTIFIGTLKVV